METLRNAINIYDFKIFIRSYDEIKLSDLIFLEKNEEKNN